MRFTKSLVLPALAALSLMVPFRADARPKPQAFGALPNLMINRTMDRLKGASPTMVYIRNSGLGASSSCFVRVQLESGAVYHFGIWSLQPGEEIGLRLPEAKDGKPDSFTITVDCERQVAESNEDDNVEQMRFVS